MHLIPRTDYRAPFIKRAKDALHIIKETERFLADRRATVNELSSIVANGQLEQHHDIVIDLLEDEAPYWSELLSRQYVRKHFPETALKSLYQVTKGLMLASIYAKQGAFEKVEDAIVDVLRYVSDALESISVQVKYLENAPRRDRKAFDAELKRDAKKRVPLPTSLRQLEKAA